MVFHLLQKNSSCQQRFDYNGWFWSSVPGSWDFSKEAGCPSVAPEIQNENRVYMPRNNINADQSYDIGSEFQEANSANLDGEATYDIYYGSSKDYMTKWCFNSNDYMYNPNSNGRC